MEYNINFNYSKDTLKFFRLISKYGISPVDWVDQMKPYKQGWGSYKPQHRNPEWTPEEFFDKAPKKIWALSSFYISSGRFDTKTIIQINNEWKKEISSLNIPRNSKLNIIFDT